MLYLTVPVMIWMGTWMAVSLRRGAVTITCYDYFEVTDSGYLPREESPIQFWTAIGAFGGLAALCFGLSVAAVVMGVAW